jgi:hypothetical protein
VTTVADAGGLGIVHDAVAKAGREEAATVSKPALTAGAVVTSVRFKPNAAAPSNNRINRSARSEVLIVPPVPFARPVMRSVIR